MGTIVASGRSHCIDEGPARRGVAVLAAEQQAGPGRHRARSPSRRQGAEQPHRIMAEAHALRRRRTEPGTLELEGRALVGQHLGEVGRAQPAPLEEGAELERLGQEGKARRRIRLPEGRDLARQARRCQQGAGEGQERAACRGESPCAGCGSCRRPGHGRSSPAGKPPARSAARATPRRRRRGPHRGSRGRRSAVPAPSGRRARSLAPPRSGAGQDAPRASRARAAGAGPP